jgi:hypothetical protein
VNEDGKGALITASMENGADGGAAIAVALAPKAAAAEAAQLRRRRRRMLALGMKKTFFDLARPCAAVERTMIRIFQISHIAARCA